ncbi:MAG TPA: ABC transporter substrate-binding protein [Anaerolineaceae bacterium]|nr:ABC transporter substrate-binding protein [Anaerolineaceae bacterium]
MKKWLPVLILVGLMLGACKGQAPKAAREITLNLTYIPNVQFAPFYVAIEKGYFAEHGLNVNLNYGNEADFIALIGSNNQQFMIASGEQVLLSRAQGLPVVEVLSWYKDYPIGVASLKEAGITSAADLKGKNVGLPGLFGASYIGFEALARRADLNDSNYSLNSIGFTQVEALVNKQVDAVVVYLANEPVQLRSRGYEINVLRTADMVSLVGNGLVTNEKTIAEDPELVKSVVDAVYRGIVESARDPEAAYQICEKYIENLVSDQSETQKNVLTESIKLWRLDKDLSDYNDQWANMQSVLLDIGLLKAPIDTHKAWTDEFFK